MRNQAEIVPVGRAVYDRAGYWDCFAAIDEERAKAKLRTGLPDQTRVAIATDGTGYGHVNLVAPETVSLITIFNHANQTAKLDEVSAYRPKTGWGTRGALNVMELFATCGFSKLNVHATLEDGARTWGLMGGLPDDPKDSWLWGRVEPRYQAIRDDLSPDTRHHLDDVVSDRSEKSLWRLVDTNCDVGPALRTVFTRANEGRQIDQDRRARALEGRDDPLQLVDASFKDQPIPFSRYLLEHAAWTGSFDLTNANGAMDRARQYVKHRSANHHPASVA